MQIRLVATGPDRYCPDCGRWLVRISEDGNFDLAAEAGISQIASGYIDLVNPPDETEIEALVVDATCLRCHPEEVWEEEEGAPRKRTIWDLVPKWVRGN